MKEEEQPARVLVRGPHMYEVEQLVRELALHP